MHTYNSNTYIIININTTIHTMTIIILQLTAMTATLITISINDSSLLLPLWQQNMARAKREVHNKRNTILEYYNIMQTNKH